MTTIRTKFSVGLFVALGLAIAIIAIIWLGMSHYFEEGQYYVAYFDESVQGLGVDSAVKYRGVSIGRVSSISVAPDSNLIQVIVKAETGLKLHGSNMVAQLKSVGITGIMFIEIDRKRANEPDRSPKISFKPAYPVIATKPSEIKIFMEGVDKILNKFAALDLEGLSSQFKATLNNMNQMIADVQIRDISLKLRTALTRADQFLNDKRWFELIESAKKATTNFNQFSTHANDTIKNLNQTIGKVDQVVESAKPAVDQSLKEFQQTISQAKITLERISSLVKSTDRHFSNMELQVSNTLTDIENTSKSLNNLLEVITDNPSSLILSSPPTPKTIISDTKDEK